MKGLLFILIFIVAQIASAQSSGAPAYDPYNPPPDYVRRMEENRRAQDKLNGKDERGMITDRPGGPIRNSQGGKYSKEEIKKATALSAPRPEDIAAFKDILHGSRTGIFRIFPDLGCQSRFVVNVGDDCENNFYGPKYFSFRKHSSLGRDLKFMPGELVADNFFSQEILVRLGDVSLEKVELPSPGMSYLNDLAAPTEMAKAREEYSRIAAGFERDGYRYTNRVTPEINMTYGLRIIAYRLGNTVLAGQMPGGRMVRVSGSMRRFLAIERDNRIDVTIAFRIIRKEDDGSITIVFRELKRQISTKLKFEKNERFVDLREQTQAS